MKNRLALSCTIAIVLLTLLSLLSPIAWNAYFELFSHFKLQYLLICFMLLPLLALQPQRTQNSKKLLIAALFCISLQLPDLLTWYLPQTNFATTSNTKVRIALANVYEKNKNYAAMRSLIQTEQPDVAVFLEATPIWQTELQPLKASFPYFFQTTGIAIYSRLPLENVTTFGPLTKPSVASRLTIAHQTIPQTITLIATHPLPPKPDLFDLRTAHLQATEQYVQKIRQQSRSPIVLVGDLNTTMWSPYYKQLIQRTSLRNARQGFGLLPTWTPKGLAHALPTVLAFPLSIPIDHCLISPEIQVRRIHTGAPVGSDHLSLITDLQI
jgi:endonuclease/exonuclease/phosphatase (EEP) superfamily protein YafD